MRKILLVMAVVLPGCSAQYVDEIKENADDVWTRNGFEVVGYEGYVWTGFGRWGGCVWYIVKRNTTTYHGCISKWGDEFHIYDLRAMDALKGN